MIDYRELDNINDNGYEIFKDEDGTVISIGLPKQQDMIKISKFQFMISTLQEDYNKIVKIKKVTEKSFDEVDRIYTKLSSIMYEMFLFLLNLNGKKVFKLSDIKNIPLDLIQQECENYIEYVNSKLKN